MPNRQRCSRTKLFHAILLGCTTLTALPAAAEVITDQYIAIGEVDSSQPAASANGNDAIGIGSDSKADADEAIAIGSRSAATFLRSIALGTEAQATADYAIAVGYQTNALASYSSAFGWGADATATYAIALGTGANAAGASAAALGSTSQALSGQSTAIGGLSYANGAGTTALGYDARAAFASATAVGYQSRAGGQNSTALGWSATANGSFAIAIGSQAQANTNDSVAIGKGSVANRVWTVSFGSLTQKRQLANVEAGTDYYDAVNVGQMNAFGSTLQTGIDDVGARVSTLESAGIGIQSQFSTVGTRLTALESATPPSGLHDDYFLLGNRSSASMDNAATFGDEGVAIGRMAFSDSYGTAVGYRSLANSDRTVALGDYAEAAGSQAVAVGDHSLAGWDGAIAIGGLALADQVNAMAFGLNAQALQNHDIAIGTDSYASAASGIAIGTRASVTGNGSVAIGYEATASEPFVFSVGNSTNSRRIVNVSPGWDDGDAATMYNLKMHGLINATGDWLVAPTYDALLGFDQVTFQGSMGTRLLNVADGTIGTGSKDAVNGGQVAAVRDALQGQIDGLSGGGGGGVDPADFAQLQDDVADLALATDGRFSAAGLVDGSGHALTAATYDYGTSNSRMTFAGVGGTVLDNVGPGFIGAGSLQAVNGGQIAALRDQLLGDIAGLDTRVSSLESSGGGGGTDPTQITNLQNQITSLDGRMGQAETGMGNLSGGLVAVNNRIDQLQSSGGVTGPIEAPPAENKPAPSATGDGAIAAGSGAKATADNSVALGTDSVAERVNTVSVGSAGNERQVTNVAAGERATDAVNLTQLNEALAAANAAQEDRINDVWTQLNYRVDEASRQANRGIASAAALVSNMPYIPGTTTMNAGVANYRGENALGIGMSRWSESGRFNLNAGISQAEGDSAIVRVGVGFVFD